MRALVLSGGGGLGAYQVGALEHMIGVVQVPYQLIVGVSVGSVNGSEVAMWPIGQEAEASKSLSEMWKTLSTDDVVDPHFLQPAALAWKPSTHSFSPLEKLLHERLDMDRMRSSGRGFHAVAVDVVSGDFRIYDQGCEKADLVRGILASSATPILHPNVRTYGADGAIEEVIYDGGIRDVSPLRQAIALGATEIDLILTQSPKLSKWDPKTDRIWNTALRVFEVMFRELVENDLDRVELYNAAVESRHPKGVGKRIVKLRVLRPSDPLPGDAARFDKDQTADIMAIGRKDAECQDW